MITNKNDVRKLNKLLGTETITIIGRVGNDADTWYSEAGDYTMSRFRLYPDYPNGINPTKKSRIDKGEAMDPIIHVAFFNKGNIEHPMHRYITKGKMVMVKTSNIEFKVFVKGDKSIGLEQRLDLKPKEGDTLEFLDTNYNVIEHNVSLLTETTSTDTKNVIMARKEAIKVLFPGIPEEQINSLMLILSGQAISTAETPPEEVPPIDVGNDPFM